MPRAPRCQKLELFVVSENVRSNDTVNAGAHVLLPAQAWGEKSGTVTNSERRISRQRAFLAPPGEAKPDWWIVSEVAKRLGFAARVRFQLGGGCVPRTRRAVGLREWRQPRFRYRRIDRRSPDEAFEAMAPVQWPIRRGEPQPRFFADGGFFADDRKARFVAPEIPALANRDHARRGRCD